MDNQGVAWRSAKGQTGIAGTACRELQSGARLSSNEVRGMVPSTHVPSFSSCLRVQKTVHLKIPALPRLSSPPPPLPPSNPGGQRVAFVFFLKITHTQQRVCAGKKSSQRRSTAKPFSPGPCPRVSQGGWGGGATRSSQSRSFRTAQRDPGRVALSPRFVVILESLLAQRKITEENTLRPYDCSFANGINTCRTVELPRSIRKHFRPLFVVFRTNLRYSTK
ncbi:hypothetical protein B0T13DRAFT_181961 [Neurospora crassa]|nr:hypothetical protein B0T13DRAFT_181961 [Neurospora crassa]